MWQKTKTFIGTQGGLVVKKWLTNAMSCLPLPSLLLPKKSPKTAGFSPKLCHQVASYWNVTKTKTFIGPQGRLAVNKWLTSAMSCLPSPSLPLPKKRPKTTGFSPKLATRWRHIETWQKLRHLQGREAGSRSKSNLPVQCHACHLLPCHCPRAWSFHAWQFCWHETSALPDLIARCNYRQLLRTWKGDHQSLLLRKVKNTFCQYIYIVKVR